MGWLIAGIICLNIGYIFWGVVFIFIAGMRFIIANSD